MCGSCTSQEPRSTRAAGGKRRSGKAARGRRGGATSLTSRSAAEAEGRVGDDDAAWTRLIYGPGQEREGTSVEVIGRARR